MRNVENTSTPLKNVMYTLIKQDHEKQHKRKRMKLRCPIGDCKVISRTKTSFTKHLNNDHGPDILDKEKNSVLHRPFYTKMLGMIIKKTLVELESEKVFNNEEIYVFKTTLISKMNGMVKDYSSKSEQELKRFYEVFYLK
jgi:hypothetical protein